MGILLAPLGRVPSRVVDRVPHIVRGAPAIALTALLAASPAWSQAPASQPDPIKPAEQLVFLDNHFGGLKAPADLVYAYEKKGTLVAPHAEEIHVRLKQGDKGVLTAVVADANGETPLSVEAPMQGNPVVIYFLEKDIAEMHTLTGGQPRYFQKRIRLALAAGPQVTPVTVTWGGKKVPARQIVIQPYQDDPNHTRFEKLVGKRYTFVFSEKVPGSVVSVVSEVPDEGGDYGKAVEVEGLRLKAAR